ncbi:hypothetical protein WP3W18E06_18770 [Raoultella ornithinolytica]|nr:hypothetical protein WP3W18E06_18770 [Raoultella ornithinolytica]
MLCGANNKTPPTGGVIINSERLYRQCIDIQLIHYSYCIHMPPFEHKPMFALQMLQHHRIPRFYIFVKQDL